jgi:hypothetical protein
MEYHDKILSVDLIRGELAVALGERGIMVKNWDVFKTAFEKELSSETPNRDDGHCTYSAVIELILKRLLERYADQGVDKLEAGLKNKPDNGPKECWPFEEKWFKNE